MPSYRAILHITGVRPGCAPETVMQHALASVAAGHLVEASSIDVPSGAPAITVRFLVEPSNPEQEDREATAVASRMQQAIAAVASTGRLRTLRRQRGRWLPID